MSYLKIEWLNSVDFGSVLYQDGFKNRIYLDVELERPDYNVTLESDMNGDNQEIPKFRKWEKVYKFTVWMQEDLVDAFTYMSVCDSIEVTPQTGETFIVQEGSMRVEPEWEEAGCLAKTTVSFVTDYAVNSSCTENMDKSCLCVEYVTIDLKMDSASFVGFPVAPGDRAFVYSTEHIADTKFTAIVYYGNATTNAWVAESYEAGTCLELSATGETYDMIYDGTYWQLKYGYIEDVTKSAPDYTVTGYAPDGTFVTLWYDIGFGWVDGGDYAASELGTGITLALGDIVTPIDFRLEIWNHSCDYGYSATYQWTAP